MIRVYCKTAAAIAWFYLALRYLAGANYESVAATVKYFSYFTMLSNLGAEPAPYLKGAVVSAFPNGIALERDSVPVNNGIAKVGLTAQPLLARASRSPAGPRRGIRKPVAGRGRPSRAVASGCPDAERREPASISTAR